MWFTLPGSWLFRNISSKHNEVGVYGWIMMVFRCWLLGVAGRCPLLDTSGNAGVLTGQTLDYWVVMEDENEMVFYVMKKQFFGRLSPESLLCFAVASLFPE